MSGKFGEGLPTEDSVGPASLTLMLMPPLIKWNKELLRKSVEFGEHEAIIGHTDPDEDYPEPLPFVMIRLWDEGVGRPATLMVALDEVDDLIELLERAKSAPVVSTHVRDHYASTPGNPCPEESHDG